MYTGLHVTLTFLFMSICLSTTIQTTSLLQERACLLVFMWAKSIASGADLYPVQTYSNDETDILLFLNINKIGQPNQCCVTLITCVNSKSELVFYIRNFGGSPRLKTFCCFVFIEKIVSIKIKKKNGQRSPSTEALSFVLIFHHDLIFQMVFY